MSYTMDIPEYADVMPVKVFVMSCKQGSFIDYDGHGYPVKDGKERIDIVVKPSRLHEIPEDATHIAWYNR